MKGDVNMGIGNKIEVNAQLQEFTERALSLAFDMMQDEESGTLENFCDDMGVSEDEVWWMFEQLGYTREEN